jgi:hypothetical protein
MLNGTKTALSIVMIFAAAPAAMAGGSANDEERGGFVIEGSTVGVNPVYHPELMLIDRDGHVRTTAMTVDSKVLKMMHSHGHLMGRSLMLWRDDKGIHVCSSCGA